ncbi:hypothetical protein [Chitinophaga deserti]|uniref:hypothetical protein n=1 Tax=Chitinophaga deserti TaxID=2164099 RepID=UPI000D6CA090|nr:hypothetical protein [Chitinophaga deserti]
MMRTLFLFIVCIWLLAPAASRAQQVQGTVYGLDSLPLSGTTVANIRNKMATLTDALGRFTISAEQGDTLIIQAMGHLLWTSTAASLPQRIYLRPRIEQLAGVEVKQRKRQLDSLADRENFRAGFDFRRPHFREVVMISPVGIGVNIHKLYKALSFSSNRSKSTFRRRLIEHERAQFVNERYNAELVVRQTGLSADSLIMFMNRYRPTYEFVLNASDYDFISYIRECCTMFRRGISLPASPQ